MARIVKQDTLLFFFFLEGFFPAGFPASFFFEAAFLAAQSIGRAYYYDVPNKNESTVTTEMRMERLQKVIWIGHQKFVILEKEY